MNQRRNWTENELQIMTAVFPNNYTDKVCQILSRSYRSVCSQAFVMKLKKTDSFKGEELKKQANRLRIDGAKFRYQKGREPENKGKKMSLELYNKCKPTFFKKGQLPHNANYDGHERISKDGYTEIRITKGKYILKHRHIWQQINGEIPKGVLVVFKDRNQQNLNIENLELISRKENMERNTIHRFPIELKQTIRLVKKLNQKIDEKQN